MKQMEKKKFIGVIVVVLICVIGFMAIANMKKLLPEGATIKFRNGNTGEMVVLTAEESKAFIEEFNGIGKKISGINLIRMGYTYHIIVNDEANASVTVRGERNFSAGLFEYETKGNVIELIEQYAE